MSRRSRLYLLLAPAALLVASCAGASAAPRVLAAADAVNLLEDNDDVIVIDVRTPAEFAQGHVAGAELIDIQAPDFRERIAELDRDGSYFVYCRTGNRSATAVSIMADLGFTDVVDARGLAELAQAGAPTAR